MKSEDKQRIEIAKQLFFDNWCSHFSMAHDSGVLDEYFGYMISAQQEEEWLDEYSALWAGNLSVDNLDALFRLQYARATMSLPALIEFANKGDGYFQLYCGYAIWDLLVGKDASNDLRSQASSLCFEIWKRLASGSFEITDAHRKEFSQRWQKFGDRDVEEFVIDCAKRKLQELDPQGKRGSHAPAP